MNLQLRDRRGSFGRIAAQTAKQVITQRIREAERDNVFREYIDRKGELITGIVRRFEKGNIFSPRFPSRLCFYFFYFSSQVNRT